MDFPVRKAMGVCALVLGCSACPPTQTHDAGDNGGGVHDAGLPDAGAGALPWEIMLSESERAALSLSVDAPNDVWLCGARGSEEMPLLIHGTEQGWTRWALAADADLWWIHRLGPTQVVVVGSAGTLMVIDESTKTARRIDVDADVTLFGVWGTHASALWAVGRRLGGDGSGVLLAVDASADPMRATQVSALPFPSTTPALMKVWGRSAEDVYVVGVAGTVLHFDGVMWTNETLEDAPRLTTIHGRDSEIVVVGGDTQAVIRTQSAGGGWSEHSPGGFFAASGVFVDDNGDVLVGGNGGTAYAREGGAWRTIEGVPLTRDWHAVAIDQDGGRWMAGGLLGSAVDLGGGAVVYQGRAASVPNVWRDDNIDIVSTGVADGGARPDAGGLVDGGRGDAGHGADAGPSFDAGHGVDAGPTDAGSADGGFDFGPLAPPLTDAPSTFDVVLGDVETDFSFAPLASGAAVEIVQGPQGGIHVELGVQIERAGPAVALDADMFARVLIVGSDVAEGYYGAVTLLEVAEGVYQSSALLAIFETDDAAPYTGWPAVIEVLVVTSDDVGWVALDAVLVDQF